MDEKTFIKLPESELEVMQGIWLLDSEGEANISAGLVMKRCPALNRLKLTTVLTLINRLQFKGFISSEKKGRANCYTPLIDAEAYRKAAAEDFCEKVYLGNRGDAVSAIIEGGALTADEKERIMALLHS